MASLERVGSEDHDDPNDSERSSDNESDEDHGGIDNEAFNHTMSWTEKAGTFVAEKMAFFERLGQDYTGGRLFERSVTHPELFRLNSSVLVGSGT